MPLMNSLLATCTLCLLTAVIAVPRLAHKFLITPDSGVLLAGTLVFGLEALFTNVLRLLGYQFSALWDSIGALDGHENPGVNPYVLQQLIPDTEHLEGDPHAALRENHTPAILLYPECNYLSWAGAIDYRKTLPNLKIYYIPKAGHYIQFEQPELLKRVLLSFLLDQPDAIPRYTSDADPRRNLP
jgi:pimeloyl-ACP methyl ester carboxylesterase